MSAGPWKRVELCVPNEELHFGGVAGLAELGVGHAPLWEVSNYEEEGLVHKWEWSVWQGAGPVL